MTLRFVFIVLAAGFFFVSGPSHAGIMDFFFPSLKDEADDPTQTLQAPFSSGSVDENNGDAQVLRQPKNTVPMDMAHLANTDIRNWTVTVVSEALTFKAGEDISEKMVFKKYFNTLGAEQYNEFLSAQKILDVVASGQYDIRSYVSESPLLINDTAVGGRYRWLYDVPLTLSYMKRGVDDYKALEAVNQNFIIRIQIGRSNAAENEDGLLVERWGGRVNKVKKN